MDNQPENNTEEKLDMVPEPITVPEPVAEQEPAAEPAAVPQYEDPNAHIQSEAETPRNHYEANYDYNVNTASASRINYEPVMDDKPMTMSDWLLTILLMVLLPCVGIPMYFVWAFSSNGNINRRNYCRAYLIVTGVSLIIGIILCIVIGAAFASYLPYYY